MTYRNIRNQRVFAWVNISGLALGIACFILIGIYVADELSYDRYHSKSDRIYRVCPTNHFKGTVEKASSCPFPLGPAMQNEFPEIEEMVRFFNFQVNQEVIRVGDEKFIEDHIFFADSGLINIFDIDFTKQKKEEILKEPFTAIISENTAERYFGTTDVIGKEILFGTRTILKINGVFKDVPPQSHFRYNVLISFSTLDKLYYKGIPNNWIWNPCWTYVLLKEGIEYESLEAKFPDFVDKKFDDARNHKVKLNLQQLTSIHLYSDLDFEIQQNSHASYISILLTIALVVLLLACSNYANLATAVAGRRAREIGIKKVHGVSSRRLFRQFLGESLLTTLFALLIALMLVELVLPLFNEFTGKEISSTSLFQPAPFILLIGLLLITSFLSGIYPAIFLSRMSPDQILKSQKRSKSKGSVGRKILVIFQLTTSTILIIWTLSVFQQIRFIYKTDLGFHQDDIIILPSSFSKVCAKYEDFKSQVLDIDGIVSMSHMDYIIGLDHNNHEYIPEGYTEGDWQFYPSLAVDKSFLKTFDIPIIAGRDYDENLESDDYYSILINETMAKTLGYEKPEDAIGKKLHSYLGKENIIGVYRDFHVKSLYKEKTPFVLNVKEYPSTKAMFLKFIAIRLKPGDHEKQIQSIRAIWEHLSPEKPFEHFYLADELKRQYKEEEKTAKMGVVFTLLAILIAIMGLTGLSLFQAEQRIREIGIRKVLGASISEIIKLVSKEYFVLTLLSYLITWPIGFLLVNKWLKSFAYQTSIQLWWFFAASLVTLLISLLISIYRARKASSSNPVDALKYE